MRIAGAGSVGKALLPLGAGGATRSERIEVEPVKRLDDARAEGMDAFATRRYPFIQAEPVGRAQRGGSAATGETLTGETLTGETSGGRTATPPPGPFLAQFIAQERLGDGLAISRAAEGVRAYRRTESPLVDIRAGATVDRAA